MTRTTLLLFVGLAACGGSGGIETVCQAACACFAGVEIPVPGGDPVTTCGGWDTQEQCETDLGADEDLAQEQGCSAANNALVQCWSDTAVCDTGISITYECDSQETSLRLCLESF